MDWYVKNAYVQLPAERYLANGARPSFLAFIRVNGFYVARTFGWMAIWASKMPVKAHCLWCKLARSLARAMVGAELGRLAFMPGAAKAYMAIPVLLTGAEIELLVGTKLAQGMGVCFVGLDVHR